MESELNSSRVLVATPPKTINTLRVCPGGNKRRRAKRSARQSGQNSGGEYEFAQKNRVVVGAEVSGALVCRARYRFGVRAHFFVQKAESREKSRGERACAESWGCVE